jgi:MerR family transcriptional regulator, light-induced transcriptional regulator
MNTFTIKDLENLTGIKAHTIRIWEQRYNFLKPQRTETNIRYYSNKELKTILNIALLNKYGFKISHIDKLSPEDLREKVVSLTQLQAQQERIVNDLIQHMVDLDLDRFEQVLDNYIMSRGIERTITQIIFPYMEKIGILWLTNHINPAQEHLVTNIIRQKLIVGIEGIMSHIRVDKTVLLYLPESEYHELGLLFTHYLLKSRGAKVLYLGGNVPFRDLEYVVQLKKPDFCYAHLTTVAANFNTEKFLMKLHDRMPDSKFIISGQLTQVYKKRIPENVKFKYSLQEVMEFITTL